jgi:hypothetical protein
MSRNNRRVCRINALFFSALCEVGHEVINTDELPRDP